MGSYNTLSGDYLNVTLGSGFKHSNTAARWYPGGSPSTSGLTNLATNTCYAYPWWVPEAITVAEIGVNVSSAGAASALVRFAVWNDNGSFYPGTLALNGGADVDVTATGAKSSSPAVALAGGQLYWFGLLTNGSIGAAFQCYQVPGGRPPVSYIPSTSLTNGFEGWVISNGSFTLGSFPANAVPGPAPFVKYRVS